MKVICSMVMSLDGYIADGDGVTVSGPSDWASFAINAKRYKNFVIGRGTNRKGGLDNIDCEYRVMVSSRPYDNASFMTAKSPENAIELLNGKVETLYLVGGGKLNASFANAGLIDELVVTIVPRVVGSGTRLFGDDSASLNLQLVDRKILDDGRVQLTYQVER